MPGARTWSALGLVLLLAGVVHAQEDCLPVNPSQVEARRVNGRWKVVQGSNWLMDFGASQQNATRARDVIRHYQLTRQCFVRRPNPAMMYFRTAAGFPQGSMAGQDAIAVDPFNVRAKRVDGRWKVVDCGKRLLDFGSNETAARQAARLIRDNRLRWQVFVGRPNAPMQYWIADPALQEQTQVALNVALRPQETNMWCWAASGRMAMEFLGHDTAQCTQANRRFNRNDCCNIQRCPDPVDDHECVRGGWPEFSKYDFSSRHTSNAALSWDDLWDQIHCRRAPVAFSWHWPGGGGHMMVAHGLRVLDGTRMVEVSDPWGPCDGDHRFITYAAYVEVAGNHTHWDDYYDIEHTGGQ
jgi:hypothetical protein